jgi:hypothetical protein
VKDSKRLTGKVAPSIACFGHDRTVPPELSLG